MPYCAVLECKNDSRRNNVANGGVSYHRFPQDPIQKSKWIDATGRQNWMPVKSSTICSNHFQQNDILISPKGYRYLNSTAIPTRRIVTITNLTNSSRGGSPSPLKRGGDFILEDDTLSAPSRVKKSKVSEDLLSKDEPKVIKRRASEIPEDAGLQKKNRLSDIPTSEDLLSKGQNDEPKITKRRSSEDLEDAGLQKKYRLSDILTSEDLLSKGQTHEPKITKRRSSENSEDASRQKKKRLSDVLVHLTKRSSSILEDNTETDSVPIKKKRKEYNGRGAAKKRVTDDDTNFYVCPKKSRMNEEVLPGSAYSTPRKQKLNIRLRWAENKVKIQKLKIKRLQTQGRRLKKKLHDVEDILKTLKEKFAMASENLATLKNLNVPVQDLIARQIANVEAKLISRKKYSPALRSFALTLHYYSPKAYEYVRSVFNTSLPHPRTLKKWYSSIGGNPGFTKESFAALKRKAESSTQPLVATLVIDEMSIRRRIEWDGQKLHGYVDMGTGLDGDHLAEAKEALVFLITAINSNFKVPVGFFLVDGVTGIQRAELVKQCLQLAHGAGINIVALTFDGCAANVSMAGHLGCCFQDFNVKFQHPVTHDPIVAVLDPCHMIKLIRNTFESYRTLLDAEGNKIEWKYLEQLNNLQYSETFHLANKLKDRHINFKNERMKVKLATQLFSLSVADAIKFCRLHLNIEGFALSEPTEKFLVIFNNIFDIFNSKNLHQYGFKKALNESNAKNVFEFLNTAFHYISTLKLADGTPVIKSLRKTGFLGFLNCIEAVKHLYISLIESKILIYLPFYKLSQDHLELLFCNIRSHGGSNNNPTARQFISAYKKILVHVELRDTNTGNCTALEQLSILNCSSAEERINRTSGLNTVEDEGNMSETFDVAEFDEPNFDESDFDVSEFSHHAIAHIAGYIVKKLIKSINCDTCVKALITSKDQSLHKLIIIKDKGGLQYPSKDVIRICQVAEKFIKDLDGNNIKKDVLMAKILRQFIGTNIFDSIARHQLGEFPASNHVTDLIKAVIMRYLNTRIHHLLKLKLRLSKRQMLNKYVIFQGQ